ncbi:MAG: hypothetical protein EOM21_19425 [Gammaproteobacteria bacterium]|nr:hypothetical protein [Gammaproteobacteria bacterium]
MANAQTPHSRNLRAETAAARRKRLEREGWRQVNVLLPPESIEALDQLAARLGSRQAAMIDALERRKGDDA